MRNPEVAAEAAAATPSPWLTVVGIGDDGLAGLTPAVRTLIETAELLVGGARRERC